MTELEKRFMRTASRLSAVELERVNKALLYCIRCYAEGKEPDRDTMQGIISGTNEPVMGTVE